MRRSWIRWSCLPLAVAGIFSSSGDAAATAVPQRATVSIPVQDLKVPLVSVDCSTARICVAIGMEPYGAAVGSIALTTSDEGNTWAGTPVLHGVKYLHTLACLSAATCVAVGENPLGNGVRGTVLRTLDAGHSWLLTPPLPKGIGRLVGLSCHAMAFCMAVGESASFNGAVAVVSDSAGRTWKRVALPRGEEDLSLVICTTSRYCIAEGAVEATIGDPTSGNRPSIITTANGGATWKQSSLVFNSAAPAGIAMFSGLTCATSTHCLLVGDATPGDGSPSGMIASSTDRGVSWTFQVVPGGTTFLNAISCGSATRCVVAGGGIEARGGIDRDILTTSDGGQTWISRAVPSGTVGLDGISCSSPTSCMAVGFGLSATDPTAEPSAVIVSTDGGTTWDTAQ
jgi:photosystem II stability/assembly factor-like uncharacterized protein